MLCRPNPRANHRLLRSLTKSYENSAVETELVGYPIKRNGKAEEVAALIAFLLGDESKYITGAAYPIDGGVLA